MIFFPAIDLKDGACVRLLHGAMETATVFADDPAAQAETFERAGCHWLHVVDLNGAFEGRPVNAAAVEAILGRVAMRVQLGGGVRSLETIERWLGAGIARVILGTAALNDPELVRAACRAHPGRIAIGIDARDGRVAVEGWAKTSETTAIDLAKRLEDAGVAALIYTDIARDGALQGPNVEATVALAESVATPVIASGGVAGMDDLVRLQCAGNGVLEGVIAGRAVYDGRIDPAAAVRLFESDDEAAPTPC